MSIFEGGCTCDGCGVPMSYVERVDRFNGQPIKVWALVDEQGRTSTQEMPDGRHPWDLVEEFKAKMDECWEKSPNKRGKFIPPEKWTEHDEEGLRYAQAYSALHAALDLGCNPYRHAHKVTLEPQSSCPWHCGEPMWSRPTGWHCRKPCQDGPFDPLLLDFIPNETVPQLN